jgi:DNA (cytosine-5)-methyltransferase 1
MLNGRPTESIAGIDWVRRKNWPIVSSSRSKPLSIVDLFCGCGGMTLGAWEAARSRRRRLDIRLAADIGSEAISVYRDNFGQSDASFRQDDIGRLFGGKRGARRDAVERYWIGRLRPLDLLVAGPPCQGHSDLNNSTRRHDPRNLLYLRVARAAELLRPSAVIIENVPAVLLDRTKVVTQAARWLESLGYHITQDVVLLTKFHVPQLRKRHILVATLRKAFDLSTFYDNKRLRYSSVGDYIAGLEDMVSNNGDLLHRPGQITAESIKRVDYLFDNKAHDLPNRLRPSCHRDKPHAYVSMYGRVHWDKPAQTLTSGFGSMGQGRYVHPTRRRLLTPHEAARIQGFPDFFRFSSARTMTSLREMIANAVPPQFSAILVAALLDEGHL